MSKNITKSQIVLDIHKVISTYCLSKEKNSIFLKTDFTRIAAQIYEDLMARIKQDPVAINDEYIYQYSRSFKTIFFYRISNFLFNIESNDLYYKYCAYQISENATAATAIEIHPQAKIGKSFVIDHGVNTLIGATSEIGDNCTLLQNVVLGSRKITFNKNTKRHPTIGNNVHISMGVRILGPVSIGNNVKIGPDCLITENIDDYSTVMLKKTHFVSKLKANEK